MPRWRQKYDPKTQTSEFVPIDEAAARQDGHFIQGDIDAFVSPIDGSVIRDRKQYREHCKKHGVVPASEFSPEFYERKAKERERALNCERTPEERFQIRQQMYEQMIRAERNE